MYNEQIELDTIIREHKFIEVGDPVPTNRFDAHDLHLQKHKERLDELKKAEYKDIKLKQFEIQLLQAHIDLHNEMKESN